MKTFGTINESSPRAETWRRIFGSTTIPLKSPISIRNEGPDGKEHEFYQVNLVTMTRDQIARAIRHCAETFGGSLDEVAAGFRDPRQGLPILAEDVSVTTDAPWFL